MPIADNAATNCGRDKTFDPVLAFEAREERFFRDIAAGSFVARFFTGRNFCLYEFMADESMMIIIVIIAHRLSARWSQPFTRSDFSMPVYFVPSGTSLVRYVDTIQLYRRATLCMDVLSDIFRPVSTIGHV